MKQRLLTVSIAGNTRITICFARWAVKIARGRRGRRCNREEASIWQHACARGRSVLCPVVYALPFGILNVMQRARPLDAAEEARFKAERLFADWPCSCRAPDFEYKGSDWGYLPAGSLVSLDYAPPRANDRPGVEASASCSPPLK